MGIHFPIGYKTKIMCCATHIHEAVCRPQMALVAVLFALDFAIEYIAIFLYNDLFFWREKQLDVLRKSQLQCTTVYLYGAWKVWIPGFGVCIEIESSKAYVLIIWCAPERCVHVYGISIAIDIVSSVMRIQKNCMEFPVRWLHTHSVNKQRAPSWPLFYLCVSFKRCI